MLVIYVVNFQKLYISDDLLHDSHLVKKFYARCCLHHVLVT